MFRHDDVTQHDQPITTSYTLEYLKEQIAARCAVEKWLAPIAAECQEVEIASAVEAVRMIWHDPRLQKRK